jgi:hypothetical protein
MRSTVLPAWSSNPAAEADPRERFAAPQHWPSMAPFLYRCPKTGLKVQEWLADDTSGDDDGVYETVTCLACTRVHLINRSTGKVLGGDDE